MRSVLERDFLGPWQALGLRRPRSTVKDPLSQALQTG